MIFAFISVLSVIIVKLNIEIGLKNVEENQGSLSEDVRHECWKIIENWNILFVIIDLSTRRGH